MKLTKLAYVTGTCGAYRVVYRPTVAHANVLSALAEFAPVTELHVFTRFRAAQNLANAINATASGRVCK